MKYLKQLNVLVLLSSVLFFGSCSSDQLVVTSPSGNNTISLHLDSSGELFYSINSHNNAVILNSKMGFDVSGDSTDYNKGLKLEDVAEQYVDESYHLPTGKTSTYINKYNEKTYTFSNRENKELKIICRAYDDGVAFRYVLESSGDIIVSNENTRFRIPDSTVTWMMNFNKGYPNYEWFYPERQLDTLTLTDFAYPALMHVKNKIWLLLAESSVYDQPGTHLYKISHENAFKAMLPQKSFVVKDKWQSPWRTFIIGNELGTIIESTLVENLNPPSKIDDIDWIEPGVVVFPWWGNYMANSYIDTLKEYVDMAAEMNWNWIEFDVSLVGSPDRTSKLWRTTEWLPEFTAYAASKGINVYGWDEYKALNSPSKRSYIFGRYKDLGIKGIKIDFLNSDDAEVMRFRDTAMREAAKDHLMVSFHGATIPRGQRRTYPNVMTIEGVRGAEYYTFPTADPPTPTYNCTMPFTRNVLGPVDYTPTTFTIRPENPRITTYAHELALPFIFESGWTCMADRPAMYLNSPAKEILKKIKTTWDETRFIAGYPGKFICLARRNGHDWYLSGINAGSPRTIDVPLDFLKEGNYDIKIYGDAKEDPLMNINIKAVSTTSNDTLHINLAKNGGFCTIIENSY